MKADLALKRVLFTAIFLYFQRLDKSNLQKTLLISKALLKRYRSYVLICFIRVFIDVKLYFLLDVHRSTNSEQRNKELCTLKTSVSINRRTSWCWYFSSQTINVFTRLRTWEHLFATVYPRNFFESSFCLRYNFYMIKISTKNNSLRLLRAF